MKTKINKKITFVSIYLIFFLIGDIFFSNFVYKKDIKHNCYKYLKDFYYLQKNCYAREKWVRNVKTYDVYTDDNGFRFSGNKSNKNKIAAFFGGSFTYGMGLDYDQTFVGLIENNQKEFEILNLAVPGYSPTVFNYQLKKLIKDKIIPNKIFLVFSLKLEKYNLIDLKKLLVLLAISLDPLKLFPVKFLKPPLSSILLSFSFISFI